MKVMFAWNSHKVQHLAEKETTLRQTKKKQNELPILSMGMFCYY